MSMKYIRDYYGVPARRGERVSFTDPNRPTRQLHGVIVSTHGAYLRIRWAGEKKSAIHHPTWGITYHSTITPKVGDLVFMPGRRERGTIRAIEDSRAIVDAFAGVTAEVPLSALKLKYPGSWRSRVAHVAMPDLAHLEAFK